jgi:hypothetical protein
MQELEILDEEPINGPNIAVLMIAQHWKNYYEVAYRGDVYNPLMIRKDLLQKCKDWYWRRVLGKCHSFLTPTVTSVTPDYHHEILLINPVILSLYATQSTHTHPWTYEDTLVLQVCPHPHTDTHVVIRGHLCTYAYCLVPYCLSSHLLYCSASTALSSASLSLGILASFLMGQTSVHCISHSIHLLIHPYSLVLVIVYYYSVSIDDIIGKYSI